MMPALDWTNPYETPEPGSPEAEAIKDRDSPLSRARRHRLHNQRPMTLDEWAEDTPSLGETLFPDMARAGRRIAPRKPGNTVQGQAPSELDPSGFDPRGFDLGGAKPTVDAGTGHRNATTMVPSNAAWTPTVAAARRSEDPSKLNDGFNFRTGNPGRSGHINAGTDALSSPLDLQSLPPVQPPPASASDSRLKAAAPADHSSLKPPATDPEPEAKTEQDYGDERYDGRQTDPNISLARSRRPTESDRRFEAWREEMEAREGRRLTADEIAALEYFTSRLSLFDMHGLDQSERHLEHYLAGTGDTLTVDDRFLRPGQTTGDAIERTWDSFAELTAGTDLSGQYTTANTALLSIQDGETQTFEDYWIADYTGSDSLFAFPPHPDEWGAIGGGGVKTTFRFVARRDGDRIVLDGVALSVPQLEGGDYDWEGTRWQHHADVLEAGGLTAPYFMMYEQAWTFRTIVEIDHSSGSPVSRTLSQDRRPADSTAYWNFTPFGGA